jgi:hypothetical protein
VTFFVNPLHLTFRAIDPVQFPTGKAANVLRGALGTALQQFPAASEWFAPRAERGPSGLRNRPRPFVLRASHLDGKTIESDELFHFDVNLFDRHKAVAATFADAFATIVQEGIGRGRGRAELITSACHPLELNLVRELAPITNISVRFVTPTELKDSSALASRPDFGILFARVRDRISALSALYGAGPLELDFKELGERAGRVKMTRCDISMIDIHRRSRRTGQVHPLGGFVGEAQYEGDLAEFVPFLEAAQFTGVGRQTVWGKGQIEVCIAPPA